MELKLVQTCGGCPEQYDAYLRENIVGYMRLRHGYFYAEHYGEIVYEARPDGDGIFTYEERDFYLTEAKNAIKQALLERLWTRNFLNSLKSYIKCWTTYQSLS